MSFRKSVYEEMYRYFEFSRDDAQDGLIDGEAITSYTVTATDNADGSDVTAAMISGVSTVSDTRVVYFVSGGTVQHAYTITVKVETSRGQRFEGEASVYITA
jgi:hypothetical protein